MIDAGNIRAVLLAASAVGAFACPAVALAAPKDEPTRSASDALLDEVVVTATKQSQAQRSQSVPLTISAFSGSQIEALKVGDVMQLATQIPGVSFEQISGKGTANFSIRGVGISGSKISTAPTVGIFVDGVYLGVNQGVIFDTFDVEGIEVLRGPQGTLFGRNVTGGAVLLRHQRPMDQPDLKLRARVESGPLYNLAAAGGGPITEALSGRLALYYELDRGYFEAPLLGRDKYPRTELVSIRPSLRYRPTDRTDVTLFGDYGRMNGEGPPSYASDYTGGLTGVPGTAPAPGRRYGPLLVQFPGDSYIKWYAATLDARQEVDLGDNASITSVTSYRDLLSFTLYDIDGVPQGIVQSNQLVDQRQFSSELRYNGTFGPATLTAGGLYFHQDALAMANTPPQNSINAARLKEDVVGVFGQVDYALFETLTLQVGGRYSYEKKHALIAPQASQTPGVRLPGTVGVPGSCRLVARDQLYGCTFFQYDQEATFRKFTPKVTVQYRPSSNVQVYATAQKAYRSGGFNSAYNEPFAQRPFDPENQRAFEVGFKSDLFDRKTRLNGVVYLTKIKDLQRDITFFDPVLLVTTRQTANTADATLKGFEFELVQKLAPGVVLNANVSRTHARYDRIIFDITADPASAGGPQVTDYDYRQRLVRVLPWTYSIGLTADRDFSLGHVTARGSYTHRDASYSQDFNVDRRDGADTSLQSANLLDAQLTFEPAGSALSFSLYGKNLTNEFTLANMTPISYPAVKACACMPNKGRVVGFEVSAGF